MRPFVISFLLGTLAASTWTPAAAEDKYDVARRQYPELFKVYYDAGILEYCGLITQESASGFRLSRDSLLTRDALSEDQHRNVRISASIAVDLEYEDRGLSGHRLWCKNEGMGAYDRFVGVYGAQHVVAP